MEELTLDSQLKRLYRKFSFLWKEYGFKVSYLTTSYDMYYHGFIVGLENDLCKLAFKKDIYPRDNMIRNFIGKKISSFAPPDQSYSTDDGWYSVSGLVFWLTGILYEGHKDADQDLEITSQYMKLHMESVLKLYKEPEAFEEGIEYYRNLNSGSRITVDNVKAERARLKALGQDWSFEAALKSLHGGGK